MTDRYTKIVLTVIAGALVYLCVVMTAFPAVQAQTQRPGEFTGKPVETVIVGWRAADPVPVTAPRPLQTLVTDTVRVVGNVQTERSNGTADRMVIVGWEENAAIGRPGSLAAIQSSKGVGVPVHTFGK
jgi:hypothetical protein